MGERMLKFFAYITCALICRRPRGPFPTWRS